MSGRSATKASPAPPGFFFAQHSAGALAWVGLCLAWALAAAVLSCWGDPHTWAFASNEFAGAAWPRRPWAVMTGPLVHSSASHLAGNLAALAGLAMFGAICRVPIVVPALALVIWPLGTIGLLVWEQPLVLVGLSGVLHGLTGLLAVHAIRSGRRHERVAGMGLLCGLLVKLAWEQAWLQPVTLAADSSGPVLVAAHLSGAACGVGLALAWGVASTVSARLRPRVSCARAR